MNRTRATGNNAREDPEARGNAVEAELTSKVGTGKLTVEGI